MIGKAMLRISICLGCLLFVSCATVRDSVVDHVAGFPASQVISDVKSTSDENEKELQEERVEELNQEYEEFLRSRETDDARPESKQSVIIKRDDGNQD